MKNAKPLPLLLLLALLLTTLFGCSATANDVDMEMGYTSAAMNESNLAGGAGLYSSTTSGGTKALVTEQKLIKTVDITAQTEDMDQLLNQLGQQIEKLGGYVENREVYNGSAYSKNVSRWATMTIRVPVENLNELVSQVEGLSNVIQHSENVDDVTLQYVDTASHKEALETEYDRLLALLEKAENMADILAIEEKLTSVRYELENITSQLQVYDNKITYATIYLSVDEVQKLTPTEEPTVGQRIADGFMDSLRDLGDWLMDLLVFLLVNSPYIILLAGVTLLTIFLTVHFNRKSQVKKRRALEEAEKQRRQTGTDTGSGQ